MARPPVPDYVAGEMGTAVAPRKLRGVDLRPPWTDVALTILLLVMAFVEERYVPLTAAEQAAPLRDVDLLAEALALLAVVPLAWRRRLPIAVMTVVIGAYAARLVIGYQVPTAIQFSAMGALYSVGVYAERPEATTARLGGLAAMAVALVAASARDLIDPIAAAFTAVAAAGVTVFGETVFVRRRYEAALEERARSLEAEREERARLAVQEERLRISRELHDVWAHTVSVMVVQAGGAEEILDEDPERAKQALRSIRDAGRRALEEVRRLVQTEREASGLAIEPAVGVGGLGRLVDEMRATGLGVELHLPPDLPVLPRDVDLAVYRIVQQALTNSLTHGGDRVTAIVRVHVTGPDLVLEVDDDGAGASVPPGPEVAGRGLIGMRERVALFRGELAAGPRPEGGFCIRARIPLGGAS